MHCKSISLQRIYLIDELAVTAKDDNEVISIHHFFETHILQKNTAIYILSNVLGK